MSPEALALACFLAGCLTTAALMAFFQRHCPVCNRRGWKWRSVVVVLEPYAESCDGKVRVYGPQGECRDEEWVIREATDILRQREWRGE